MRYPLILCALLTALLLAGAAWGEGLPWEIRKDMVVTLSCEGATPLPALTEIQPLDEVEYEITIYGTNSGVYRIVYTWYASAPEGARFWIGEGLVGFPETGEWRYGGRDENNKLVWEEYAVYTVDSLADIRPTPAEMEEK